MITALVGYTGFVGSNLWNKYPFTHKFNSKNISEAFNLQPDILVYAGVKAEKFLANQNAGEDLNIIHEAFRNINNIRPKKLVLISTIDVYPSPDDVDEESMIIPNNLHPYGANRYTLEELVRNQYPSSLIVRLPGLFGENIKKNFIYDFIHMIPSNLSETKFFSLAATVPELMTYYNLESNGFYKCRVLSIDETQHLKNIFQKLNFTALNFTDSRGVFQFYHLKELWGHIQIALDHELHLVNMAVEPVQVNELYEYLTGNEFVNEISTNIPFYNFRTQYSELFHGSDGYIFHKQAVLTSISNFIKEKIR